MLELCAGYTYYFIFELCTERAVTIYSRCVLRVQRPSILTVHWEDINYGGGGGGGCGCGGGSGGDRSGVVVGGGHCCIMRYNIYIYAIDFDPTLCITTP